MKKQEIKKLLKNIKKQITNFKPSKTFIAITSLLIGIGSTVLAQNLSKKEPTKQYYLSSPSQDLNYQPPKHKNPKHPPFTHNFFNDPDPFGNSIFDEIDKMQHHFDQIFESHRQHIHQNFKNNLQNHQTHNSSISKQETKNSYIFELNFNGFNKDEITIEIKDKILNISANSNKKDKSKKHHHQSSSNFYYSFFLNKLDQNQQPQIKRQKNNIIITLKKLKD